MSVSRKSPLSAGRKGLAIGMNNTVTIRATDEKIAGFALSPEKAAALGLGNLKCAVLRFGNIRCFTEIEQRRELGDDTVRMTRRLMDQMHLPEYPVYELAAEANEIVIGPFIGLLLSEKHRRLTASRLDAWKVYVREYERLHGAVVVFALDKVDTASRLIEGYGYNPGNDAFEKGIFPYPAAFFRTIGLSSRWKNHFLSAIGDRFFNYPYFNKWQMYRWLSGDAAVGAQIPFTTRYESPEQLLRMLEQRRALYVKPMAGLKGRGVVRAEMENGAFVFRYHENDANHRDVMAAWEEARAYCALRFARGRFLIQQPVELLRIDGRIADFRCIMQKDLSGRWVCRAIVGRYGQRGSVVSNISSGGHAFSLPDLEQMTDSFPRGRAQALQDALIRFALAACGALDRTGVHCGSVGLDIGVDAQGKLWLIEINNRDPDPSIALNVGNTVLYHSVKSGPLFYAKGLAGFSGT